MVELLRDFELPLSADQIVLVRRPAPFFSHAATLEASGAMEEGECMRRNERLDAAIRNVLEVAGCLDEQELASSVARTLRAEGLRSITSEAVIAYLEVYGAEVLGPPVHATQSEVDFAQIQQRLTSRLGTPEDQTFADVLARGLKVKDPVAMALADWLQQNVEQEFAVSQELLSLLRAAEAKLHQ